MASYNFGRIVLENRQKHEIIYPNTLYLQNKTQHPHSPYTIYFYTMLENGRMKIVLDESVLSILYRGGEGQNVYDMNFSNPCDQGCSSSPITRIRTWPITL